MQRHYRQPSAMHRRLRKDGTSPAWLGLVPRQITTGGRPRLVRISKRGSTYKRPKRQRRTAMEYFAGLDVATEETSAAISWRLSKIATVAAPS